MTSLLLALLLVAAPTPLKSASNAVGLPAGWATAG